MEPADKLKRILFDEWKHLVPQVIDCHFYFVFDPSNVLHNVIRRPVERSDLEQEGYLALQDAILTYDPDHQSRAKLKSYVWSAIRKRVGNYIERNSTPLKVGRRRDAETKGSQFVQSQRTIADGCQYFSEIERDGDEDDSPLDLAHRPIGGLPTSRPEAILESNEFTAHCIQKLKDQLSDEDFTILLERYSGAKLASIADRLGIAPSTLHYRLRKIMAKARVILGKESRDNEG